MPRQGYRIFRDETLAETYMRATQEQLQLSLDYCADSSREPDVATHEIRKCVKRIRATNRLYRQAIEKTAFRHGRDQLRSIGKILAPHRISKAYIEVLSNLSGEKRLQPGREEIEKLKSVLQERHNALTRQMVDNDLVFKKVNDLLSNEMERVLNNPVLSCDFTMLADRVRITYSRGKADLNDIQTQNTAENFHNLRKTVKCLWNQILLIRPVWPSYLGQTVHFLDSLAEKLGYDHDLADLQDLLIKENIFAVPVLIHEIIDLKRKHLHKSILPAASMLFSENPETFSKRLKAYHKVYQAKKT